MKIYTRAELGSRPFVTPPTIVPLSVRQEVTFHYPGAGTPPRGLRAYRKWIENIHMDERGWRGVGYNYLIADDGSVGEGAGRDVIGAHSPPHNRDGIGVNLWTSNGIPTPEGFASARELYDQLCEEANRTLRVGWHNRDYATDCPGPKVLSWIKSWTNAERLPIDVVKPPATKPVGDSKPAPKGYPAPAADCDVYLDKLRPGTRDSDSVWRWQQAMNALSFRGGSELKLTGTYDDKLAHETGLFQVQVCGDKADGWPGPKQATLAFQKAKAEMRRNGVRTLSIYKSSATGGLVTKVW